jgi:RHS repeat-associated protein
VWRLNPMGMLRVLAAACMLLSGSAEAGVGQVAVFDLSCETTTVNGDTWSLAFDKPSLTFIATTPEGRSAQMQVDGQRRPLAMSVPGLAPVEYAYDARGRLASVRQGDGGQAREYRFEYDAFGYLSRVTDPLGRAMTLHNDRDGRPTRLTTSDGREIGLAFDGNGNVAALTTPKGPVHRFGFDPLDRETRYEAPPLGAEQTVTTTEFDRDGQFDRQQLPGGITVDASYDAGGRLSHISRPAVDGDLGNEVRLEYQYDAFLPILERSRGALTAEVGFGYDNHFRLRTLRAPGATTTYGFDRDGQLVRAESAPDDPLALPGEIALQHDPAHGLLRGTAAGVVSDTWTWSPFAEASAYEARAGPGMVYQGAFERDAVGRITRKSETVLGHTTVYDYAYDLAGRLEAVRIDGQVSETYTYDANGNRERLTRGSQTTDYRYDDQDRLLSEGDCTYTWTANGELASRSCSGQTTTYRYTVHGDLTQVELPDGRIIEYVVDGRGRRVGKRIDGDMVQGLVYADQLNPVAEFDGDGNVVATYVYADRGHVPSLMHKAGRTYRLVADHLGSVRLVIDTHTGAIAQRIDYDAWGKVLLDTQPGFQPFGYAGGITDRDTGLIKFGARDYDPGVGRWTSKDPIGFGGGQPSLYDYVGGDPINFYDPNGLWRVGDPLPQWLVDGATGFGDGIFETVSFGYGSLGGIRNSLGIDGGVDECSGVYRASRFFGENFNQLARVRQAGFIMRMARGGETNATRYGRQAHRNYPSALGDVYQYDRPIGSGSRLRPDAIDWVRKIVRELKPDSPSGVRRGEAQLRQYLRELGPGWTGHLDLYRRPR